MKPPKTMQLPWTVFADHRTSCAYLVYDKDENFFKDEDSETMDAAAAYIQHCVNLYPALVDALRLIKDAGQTATEVIAEEALRKAGEI